MKKKRKWMPVLMLLFALFFTVQTVQAEITSSELILGRDKETGERIYVRKFIVDGKVAVCIEGLDRADQCKEYIFRRVRLMMMERKDGMIVQQNGNAMGGVGTGVGSPVVRTASDRGTSEKEDEGTVKRIKKDE